MALALTLEKLDGIDPAVAALYTEKDGKFTLDVEGLEDTSALKAALKEANREAAERRKALEKLKDVDPEEYQRLKTEAAERETKKLTEAGEFDKLREKWAKEQADKDAEWTRKVAEKAFPSMILALISKSPSLRAARRWPPSRAKFQSFSGARCGRLQRG